MNLTGSPDYGARIVYTGDPGSGCSSDQYSQFNVAAVTGPTYDSVGLESGRNIMRGCPDKTVDLSLSRDIRMGGNRAARSSGSTCSTRSTRWSYDNRQDQIQFNSPTDLTVRNSQSLANGSSIRPGCSRATPGFGAATSALADADVCNVYARFAF